MLAVALSSALAACAAPTAEAPRPTTTPSVTASPELAVDPVEAEIEERLAAMSTRDKIASLLMLHQPGTDGTALAEFMRSTGAGGFIVMGDNVGGSVDVLAGTTAALAVDPALPPLIGIDEEGGIVARLDEDTLPAAEQLKTEAPDATKAAFAARADLVHRGGANLNFGIVADMTGDPDSFIFDRVYGSTPEDTAARVEQAVAGERGLVASTLKHFPGHGRSEADSHSEIPVTDVGYDEWRVTDAVPFERGVAAGAEAVMFGHLAYTSVDGQPASLSPRWHEILRTELHFDGLAVTDDMLMLQHTDLPEFQDPVENGIRAISAGNDVLVYVLAADPSVSGVDPYALIDGLTAAADSGRILPEVLDEAARRVLAARIALR
ncbi:glycosyl hydrolase family 3 [Amnibacterium flavum]|uniref:Glycosyl hydrolase family 3 n=1 Tax=Amnibacterium flavum TaxID=2173173 RepID=A0A2V1HQS8_9MICO|nr:glycosyl hydrolase family 3 [Amnibacterium flavum]